MYQRPVINAEKVCEVSGVSMPSSYKLIAEMGKIEILKKVAGGQRGCMYVFEDYLNLFR
jgi:hypothetical protein